MEKDEERILIVDDNPGVLFNVKMTLKYNKYKVITATNGEEAIKVLSKMIDIPDLIISDVMMPVMNGLEMSKQLKTHNSTKTIPIILLTAKSSKREVVEGLQTGADDYLSKPFDSSELIMRVAGLINNRKLIRKSIQLDLSPELIQHQDDFASQLNKIITNQISNPNLTVEVLAKTLNMSPSSVFRKCNEKINKPPVQIIREIRMIHAMKLLKGKKLTISEIAYGTGFESLSYFSRRFKKHYGQSPSAIRET